MGWFSTSETEYVGSRDKIRHTKQPQSGIAKTNEFVERRSGLLTHTIAPTRIILFMRRTRFGRTNADVSAVSLGTWGYSGTFEVDGVPVGWSGHDDDLARQAVVQAWNEGINHWDTADVYGDGRSESIIGGVWDQVPRDAIFLATKVGWSPGTYPHCYHPALIRERLERSLENLRTDRIDLYYMHHCDFGDNGEYFDDAIETIRRARDEGKIRFIGLSDWDATKIMRYVDRCDPDAVQPYRNVVDDAFVTSGLREWVGTHDLGVAFFSPIKHGLLLGKYDKPAEFPAGDFRRRIPEFADEAFLERMQVAKRAMEERFSASSEPVLHAVLGALLADTPTGCVLLGQRNPRQVKAASQVGEPLTAEDAAWVRAVYNGEQ